MTHQKNTPWSKTMDDAIKEKRVINNLQIPDEEISQSMKELVSGSVAA